jgi:hypothetical protein
MKAEQMRIHQQLYFYMMASTDDSMYKVDLFRINTDLSYDDRFRVRDKCYELAVTTLRSLRPSAFRSTTYLDRLQIFAHACRQLYDTETQFVPLPRLY